jgi:hypothetical protein
LESQQQQQQITLSKFEQNNHKQQQHQFQNRAKNIPKSMQAIEKNNTGAQAQQEQEQEEQDHKQPCKPLKINQYDRKID